MARAARPGRSRASRPRSACALACAIFLAAGTAAAAAVESDVVPTNITYSSLPEGLPFSSQDDVTVTYTSPFSWPMLSVWCDPDSPRQESIQRARPFSGQAVVQLSRIQQDDTYGAEDKVCWFNLSPLTEPTNPGIDSKTFTVAGSRGRRRTGDGDDEHQLELRDSRRLPSRTIGPRNKRQTRPDIPEPTAQQTSGPGSAFIACPGDNRTVFTDPVTAKRYVVLCGRDYHSNDGALDIKSVPSGNLNDCIALCASEPLHCTAVSWGWQTDNWTCFLKRSIGQPTFPSNWRAAVEDPSQPGTGAKPSPAPQGGPQGPPQLSVDTKAGIGVGAALGVVLIAAGAVAVWYCEQRRQLRRRRLEIEERKLDVASGSTDGGGAASPARSGSQARLDPPTRSSSYRSESQAVGAEASDGRKANAVATSTSAVDHAGSIRSKASGPRATDEAGETALGLAHVAMYIQQQQQQQQQEAGDAKADKTAMATPGGTDGSPTGPGGVSPRSAAAPAYSAGPTSELPAREGHQGYGPNYELPTGAEHGPPPRPHRAPGQPMASDAAEQKFLLSDMAAMKVRVLRPDDRSELP